MLTDRRYHRQRSWVLPLILAALAVCLWACQPGRELALSGKTMGTTYHIKVVAGWLTSGKDLQKKIDARLAVINRSMSSTFV